MQLLALFPLMSPGDRVIASNKLYGGSITQLGEWECVCIFVNVCMHICMYKAMQSSPEVAESCTHVA
jgi:O-acetylhomoserine/O-acetylserine sulfhydrylase-like pyridoxal-dependent enzyme